MSLEHLAHATNVFAPSPLTSLRAHIRTLEQYETMYRSSLEESDAFWLQQARTLDWVRFPTLGCQYVWNTAARDVHHSWFEDGQLNVSFNCLDRHLRNGRKSKIALIWQGDGEEETRTLTFFELHRSVCQFANVLKKRGINKGDRVCIYLGLIPEAAIAMLACARIGAIHSVVFGGFSSEALTYRMQDAKCKALITANRGIRGGKKIPLKEIADEAIKKCPSIETVLVIRRTEDACPMAKNHFWYHEQVGEARCDPEVMDAEDPLCILYTSGSTGKPKGVVHTQAGYLLHASLSHKTIFDIHESDIYWCTADVGWVTGHSYLVYGPLANGCTTLMFEGTPTFPDPGRFWQIVDKYKVNVLYTAPTVIRALIAKGDAYPARYDLSSLRILGSVGEPINPEAWNWYYTQIGKNRCPIVDTWWQTETGGILITPLPGVHSLKPGSASRPFFGTAPCVLRDDGTQCSALEGGSLVITRPWPGMMRTLWGDHDRFIDTYFSKYSDCYFTGDGCYIDEEGDFWLLGRMDDVVNISGHRLGTAEVESALVSHEDVAEAAVVPIPDPIKGQALYAFVILMDGVAGSKDLQWTLAQHVRSSIGAIAVPDTIHFTESLPKTRSGKIMRRILRQIAAKESHFGDLSTLADPSIIGQLIHRTKESE